MTVKQTKKLTFNNHIESEMLIAENTQLKENSQQDLIKVLQDDIHQQANKIIDGTLVLSTAQEQMIDELGGINEVEQILMSYAENIISSNSSNSNDIINQYEEELIELFFTDNSKNLLVRPQDSIDESISLLAFNDLDKPINESDTQYKISHPWNLLVAGDSIFIEQISDARNKLEDALEKVDLKISENSTTISEQQILDYQSIPRDTVVDFILNEMSKVDNKDKVRLELFSNLISGQQQIPKEIFKTTNITPDSNTNKSIYIKEVNMNYNTMLTDLHIIAIPNDMYYIRVAEDESVVNYFEETIPKYVQEKNSMKISFKKGHRYRLTLFDRYNTPVDVWSFISDRDFSYSDQPITLIQKAPLPVTLPKTSDTNFSGAICLTIILVIILFIYVMHLMHKLNTH